MGFVKLDCGILDSTLWVDREAREIFITALLMAVPFQVQVPTMQLKVRTLEPTGFEVQPGRYGFVAAAGPGIVRRAGIELEAGMAALERLGSPEPESRTPDFEGRRLVRVDGGYLALNYSLYREKDHTAAVRSKRWRENRKPRKRNTGDDGKPASDRFKARERRFVEAEKNGEQDKADTIAAEGIPG